MAKVMIYLTRKSGTFTHSSGIDAFLYINKYNQPTLGYLATPPSQSETCGMRRRRIGVWVSPEPCGFRRSAPSHTVHTEPVKRHPPPHPQKTTYVIFSGSGYLLVGEVMVEWRNGYILNGTTNSWYTYAAENGQSHSLIGSHCLPEYQSPIAQLWLLLYEIVMIVKLLMVR